MADDTLIVNHNSSNNFGSSGIDIDIGSETNDGPLLKKQKTVHDNEHQDDNDGSTNNNKLLVFSQKHHQEHVMDASSSTTTCVRADDDDGTLLLVLLQGESTTHTTNNNNTALSDSCSSMYDLKPQKVVLCRIFDFVGPCYLPVALTCKLFHSIVLEHHACSKACSRPLLYHPKRAVVVMKIWGSNNNNNNNKNTNTNTTNTNTNTTYTNNTTTLCWSCCNKDITHPGCVEGTKGHVRNDLHRNLMESGSMYYEHLQDKNAIQWCREKCGCGYGTIRTFCKNRVLANAQRLVVINKLKPQTVQEPTISDETNVPVPVPVQGQGQGQGQDQDQDQDQVQGQGQDQDYLLPQEKEKEKEKKKTTKCISMLLQSSSLDKTLPADILGKVFDYLCPRSSLNLALSGRTLYDIFVKRRLDVIPLGHLSDELVSQVFHYVGGPCYLTVSLVCKRFHQIVLHNHHLVCSIHCRRPNVSHRKEAWLLLDLTILTTNNKKYYYWSCCEQDRNHPGCIPGRAYQSFNDQQLKIQHGVRQQRQQQRQQQDDDNYYSKHWCQKYCRCNYTSKDPKRQTSFCRSRSLANGKRFMKLSIYNKPQRSSFRHCKQKKKQSLLTTTRRAEK